MSVRNFSQKFVDKVEDLKHSTKTTMDEMQKCCCPMVKDIYLNYQFTYWYNGFRDHIWEDDIHMYAVNEIPYCYDNDIGNVIFQGNLLDLINEDKVWPFLLFINGHVVQWSRITIIKDYDYSYMRIDDEVDDYCTSAKIVYFPLRSKRIRYGENEDYSRDDRYTGLYFDEKGYLLESPEFAAITLRLEFLKEDIYLNLASSKRDIISSEDSENLLINFPGLRSGFVPTLDNMIIFSRLGEFIGSAADNADKIRDDFHGAYSTFVVDPVFSELDAIIVQMYFLKHEHSSSHLYLREEDIDKSQVVGLMEHPGSDPLYLAKDLIFRPFDFTYSRDMSYYNNVRNAVRTITRYDFSLWNDVFTKESPVKSFVYTGKEFKNLADGKSYVHFSRKHSDLIEDVAMMFVNSELYEHSVDITYSNNTINIPAFGIRDTDVVEVVLFCECNNNIVDIVVPSDGTPVYIHPEYILEDCYIMDDQTGIGSYDVPENYEGRKEYICTIDEWSVDDNNNYTIRFKDVSHYDKTLRLVPKRQMRYYKYTNLDTQYRILLPTEFNYCHDTDRYMIFVNGRKIDKDEYTITVMNEYRPFDSLLLYISTMIEKTDRVDIYYVPEYLKEKYKKTNTTLHGMIWLKTNYPKLYAMSKYTCMVFVNGRKINPLEIKDVDMNTMLVNTRYKAISNVTVIEFLDGSKEVAKYLYGLEGSLQLAGDLTYNEEYKTLKNLCGAILDQWTPGPRIPNNLTAGVSEEKDEGYAFLKDSDIPDAMQIDETKESITLDALLPEGIKVYADEEDEAIVFVNKNTKIPGMIPEKLTVLGSKESELISTFIEDSNIPDEMIVDESNEIITLDAYLKPESVAVRTDKEDECVQLINLDYQDNQVNIGIEDLDFSKYLYDQWTLVIDTLRNRLSEIYDSSTPDTVQMTRDESEELMSLLGIGQDQAGTIHVEVDPDDKEMLVVTTTQGEGVSPFVTMNVDERGECITILNAGEEESYQQMAVAHLYELFEGIESSELEQDYKVDYAPLKSVLYDIVTDYYVQRNGVNTGSPFTYDFEVGQFENDKAGNKDITLYPDQDKFLDYHLDINAASEPDVVKDNTFHGL